MAKDPSRRVLLKSGAAGTAFGLAGLNGTATAEAAEDTAGVPAFVAGRGGSMIGVPFERHDEVRVGIIGLGARGSGMTDLWASVPGVRVTAICDVRAERVDAVAARLVADGYPEPAKYVGGDPSYEAAIEASRLARSGRDIDMPYTDLCKRDDIDFVYSPTPWEWHFPTAMTALRHGKHAGTEVPFAMELSHLWELVAMSERTRRHCLMMEQIGYSRNEMRLLRMAHEGLFGDVLHAAGAYIHDLRSYLFGLGPEYFPQGWRRLWHTRLDGCFYPTHGLVPVAGMMDVNRGDRFTTISSSSSPAMGLAAYRAANVPPDHESWQETYVAGDRNLCIIGTEQGRQIRVEHDVSTPHPYSRLNFLAGTKGLFEDFPARIYLEPDMDDDEWGDFDAYEAHDHWLWKEVGGGGGGHGGSDYLMLWRLAQTMRLGLVPDMDVYDAAAWTAPTPLSTESLKRGGRPVKIPDFTRGHWREYRHGFDSPRPDNDPELPVGRQKVSAGR
jgi:Oxidoreductase family, NAD-binding Rossmann fold